jgi:AraC-like DNA-binding protein
MKIYNVEEHLSCYCYSNEDKPLFEVRKNKQIETEELSLLFNEIVFVLKGTLYLKINNKISVNVSAGRLIFLPANYKIRIKTTSGSILLIMRIMDDLQLCHTFNLNRLKNNIVKIDKPDTFESMEINTHLKHFAKGMVDTCNDGLKCQFYFKAKITEALIMLRAYYSEKQLLQFLYYYFSPDTAFAEFIRTNHLSYLTVNEFANALNMTPQQFSRRFNIVFGETPYGWMLREKAQLIYGEICRSNRSLKEIAEEYGFIIQPNFNRFCKKTFGMSPREIRKARS